MVAGAALLTEIGNAHRYKLLIFNVSFDRIRARFERTVSPSPPGPVAFIGDEIAYCAPAFLEWKGAAHVKAAPFQTD